MRDIKYRGLSELQSKWYEGDFITDVREFNRSCDKAYILPHWDKLNCPIQVLPNSVGQYTGLKDKNGREIFEGDIVSFVVFDYLDSDVEYKGVVKYRSGLYEIWKNADSEFFGSNGPFILNHAWLQDDEFEVIGNIYENPELLNA
ncbi:YopX family protein [Viridibacillus arvi]|uniref:YopX family protein n=1 Tax=Viridibacillus arvi TaxID=263475 RepID=UPI003D27A6B2